jgi:hypothetical protein
MEPVRITFLDLRLSGLLALSIWWSPFLAR